ncbi:MAG: hypothetical protein JWO25_2957 [Alphaproteobacteria bacterium]|nr:hypothetical protein [Alphaproteobacteria bacterium]
MNWLRRIQRNVSKPFYFYGWREGRYVLEHEGEYKGLADAQAEGLRIAGRLDANHHLHILDHDHRLVKTISPAAPGLAQLVR